MKFANIKEVAQKAGVSVSTVSRVINNSGYASEEAKKRVIDAVSQLNYNANFFAKNLKTRTTRTVGLVITDITNPFFSAIARATEDLLSEYDYNLIICNTNESPDKELRHFKMLYERRVDGILLCGTGKNNDFVKKLIESGVIVILIDRYYEDLDLDVIKDDNIYGAKLLTEQLIAKGHTNIALIKGHINSRASVEREEGYLAALKKHGIEPSAEIIFNAGATGETVQDILDHIWEMNPRPTAILSLNASIAKKFIGILNTRNIRVPQDVALASYGLEEFKTLYVPSITCIVQKPELYGEIAGNLMIERLLNEKNETNGAKKHILFAPDLFVGNSI